MSSVTPMMAQYQAVKAQNPDCLVFFRLGDFYELFGEDAQEASRLLGITLTARSSGEGRTVKVPMAGVPYHAASSYIQKLLQAGRKVAVCEQMEDPRKAKGMVRRELVRIITPGTALEEGFLDGKANNYAVALVEGPRALGLAAVDNASGDFFCCELPKEIAAVEAELSRLRPAEILLPEGGQEEVRWLGATDALISRTESWRFAEEEAARCLKEHFAVATLEAFGLSGASTALRAAGGLLAYLKRTQRSPLSHLTSLRLHQPARHLQMDASTRRHLELTANTEDGTRSGTLFEVLDRGATAAGARLLQRWLHAPLTDLDAIGERHDGVEELCSDAVLRAELRKILGATADLERALGRVGCLAANARDLLLVRQTLAQLPALREALRGCRSRLLAAWRERPLFTELLEELQRALVDDPPLSVREGGMFRPGYSAELDAVVEDAHGARATVLEIQERERRRTGNPKLKVQFNSVFGFYIEVTRAQSGSVPPDYERKQTLVGTERFTTPELKEVERRVLSADERRQELEARLFEELRSRVAAQSAGLMALAAALAELDALLALACAAAELEYVRPEMRPEPVLEIEQGRHPVVEYLLRKSGGGTFTANDCRLAARGERGDAPQIQLLTGPNMAGKSTYLRQAALIAVMAQAGSFVPARRAVVGVVDRLFTRIGASDRLSRGMSTFLVEMTETAGILRNATRHSLVILDEIGRGTSTYDGVSIAWAVAEHLHEDPALGCRTLFATHYFELTELAERLPGVRNFQVAVQEWQGKILFLHQVLPGCSQHSYGIDVARLAGVPEAVVRRAREVLRVLEQGRHAPPAASGQQMDLFTASFRPQERAVLEQLLEADPERLTPLQALELLASWRKTLQDARQGAEV